MDKPTVFNQSAMTSLNKFCQLFLVVVISLMSTIATRGQSPTGSRQQADSIKVGQVVNNFLIAFRNLDWNNFTEYFADDATAFFPPSTKYPYRANNKSEILTIFKIVFENARKNRSGPPYLDIDPNDMKIQLSGQVAIVSFTLNDPEMLSRRTLVWTRRHNRWTIIHLHASGVPLPEK